MVGVEDLVGALELEPIGPDRYRAGHVVANGHGVVFGGQLLAQSLVAAVAGHEAKQAKTLHTVFARGASPDEPLDITVEPMHTGRAFASSTVTISQGDRLCTRSIVLLSADEPDFITHADPAPAVAPPTDGGVGAGEWEVRVVDDVDVSDPELAGPPDLDVWSGSRAHRTTRRSTRPCWRSPPTASSSAPPCGPMPGSARPRPTSP